MILRGNPNGRKPHNAFVYIFKSKFIGNTNFPILQLQLDGGSNLKEATTP